MFATDTVTDTDTGIDSTGIDGLDSIDVALEPPLGSFGPGLGLGSELGSPDPAGLLPWPVAGVLLPDGQVPLWLYPEYGGYIPGCRVMAVHGRGMHVLVPSGDASRLRAGLKVGLQLAVPPGSPWRDRLRHLPAAATVGGTEPLWPGSCDATVELTFPRETRDPRETREVRDSRSPAETRDPRGGGVFRRASGSDDPSGTVPAFPSSASPGSSAPSGMSASVLDGRSRTDALGFRRSTGPGYHGFAGLPGFPAPVGMSLLREE
jgi:hypothetical protein